MTALVDSIYFLPVFAALSMLAAALGIYHINRRMRVADRLRKTKEEAVGERVTQDETLFEKPLPFLWKFVSFLGVLLPGHVYSDTLRLELIQAGYHHGDARRAFAGFRVLQTVGNGCFEITDLTATVVALT